MYIPRDFPRLDGMYIVQPNTSRLETVYSYSLIINPSLGMYQEMVLCKYLPANENRIFFAQVTSTVLTLPNETSVPLLQHAVIEQKTDFIRILLEHGLAPKIVRTKCRECNCI